MHLHSKYQHFTVFFLFLLMMCFSISTMAQQRLELSLEETIRLAKEQSYDALIARHTYLGNYWEYRTHLANLRPNLNLNSTVLNYRNSIDKVSTTQGDVFYYGNQNNSNVNLSLNQAVPFSGGSFFIQSNLERLDDFLDSDEPIDYSSSPFRIGYSQPLFSFNSLKWERKIEPLLFEEAKRSYTESMEAVSLKAINYFFDFANSKIELEIARINYSNNDTLYKIAEGRFNIGTIARNDLLQIELGFLTAQSNLKQAQLNYEIKQFQLQSFLGFNELVDIELIIPQNTPKAEVDYQRTLELARKNNIEMLTQQRRLLESEREVSRAKSQSRFQADLYASYGLTNQSPVLGDAYRNLDNSLLVNIGVSLPIIDWGKGKGLVQIARSNQEVIQTSVRQNLVEFDQQVYLLVREFNIQEDQFLIAAKADTVAMNKYEVTKQRFLIGKIDVLQLNIAQTEKDSNRRGYISALRNYWVNYYNLRRLTHFDFIENKPITTDFEKF